MQEDDGVITRFHLSFPTVKEMTQFNPQFVPPSIKSAIYLALAQSVFVLWAKGPPKSKSQLHKGKDNWKSQDNNFLICSCVFLFWFSCLWLHFPVGSSVFLLCFCLCLCLFCGCVFQYAAVICTSGPPSCINRFGTENLYYLLASFGTVSEVRLIVCNSPCTVQSHQKGKWINKTFCFNISNVSSRAHWGVPRHRQGPE